MPKKNNATPRAQRSGKLAANARSGASAASPESPPQTSTPAPPPRKPRRRGKRIPMGEALRKVGLDELALAGNLSHVVNTLTGKTDQTGDVEKLLVDVLKECAKHLEDVPATRGGSPAATAPNVVQLVHYVSRPARSTGVCAAPGSAARHPEVSRPA